MPFRTVASYLFPGAVPKPRFWAFKYPADPSARWAKGPFSLVHLQIPLSSALMTVERRSIPSAIRRPLICYGGLCCPRIRLK